MGYRVEYGNKNTNAVFYKTSSRNRWRWIVAVVTVCVLIVCYTQRNKLIDFILPGDPAVTREAIGVFVNELKAGERAGDAFGAFCKVIVDEAKIS